MIGGVITVRTESASDAQAIADINEQAFGGDAEARLVAALRRTPAFVPELSLVACDGPVAVGHILFTRLPIVEAGGEYAALALAPVAVLPAWQRRGVGSALVRAGLAAARELGYPGVIVLGHSAYYPRFGFVPARGLGISGPYDAAGDSFMALELREGSLRPGRAVYPAPFAEV